MLLRKLYWQNDSNCLYAMSSLEIHGLYLVAEIRDSSDTILLDMVTIVTPHANTTYRARNTAVESHCYTKRANRTVNGGEGGRNKSIEMLMKTTERMLGNETDANIPNGFKKVPLE